MMHNFSTSRFLLLMLIMLSIAGPVSAQVGIVVNFGPPALPVYEQPPCPGDNYIWVPGTWAFDSDFDDYYWVPGTWVRAPEPGLYWTPGYWAWTGNGFFFHEGYWAPEVGFYGGIVYGFGYFGSGYDGGRWDHDRFFYNRAVNNVNTTLVRNVYNTTVINNNVTVNRVSYNGGNGGVAARPTPQEEAVERQRHVGPVEAQTQHAQAARGNRDLRASVNEGSPPIAATAGPGRFSGREVVRAQEAGAPYHPPANRATRQGDTRQNPRPESNSQPENGQRRESSQPGNNQQPSVIHPRDLPPFERQTPPTTGDQKRDQKIQQQQEKLQAQQEQQRQKLEQRQEREDQQLHEKKADEARTEQMEQRHRQETEQMEQRHDQQQQKLEPRQPPPEHPGEVHPPKQEHPN